MLAACSASAAPSAKLFLALCQSRVSLAVFRSADVRWLGAVTDTFAGLSVSE